MKTEGILRKIKKLELTSGFLAILAPIIAALIGADNKMLVMLLICGVGIALQPYIYILYKRADQKEIYLQKRFWPLTLALIFILFLVTKNYYGLSIY
jgi:hypothetical protein